MQRENLWVTLVIVVVALPTSVSCVVIGTHNANRIGIAGCVGWIVVEVLMREAEVPPDTGNVTEAPSPQSIVRVCVS